MKNAAWGLDLCFSPCFPFKGAPPPVFVQRSTWGKICRSGRGRSGSGKRDEHCGTQNTGSDRSGNTACRWKNGIKRWHYTKPYLSIIEYHLRPSLKFMPTSAKMSKVSLGLPQSFSCNFNRGFGIPNIFFDSYGCPGFHTIATKEMQELARLLGEKG